MFFVPGAKCVIVAVADDDPRLEGRPEASRGMTVASLRARQKAGVVSLPPTNDIAIDTAPLEAFANDVRLFLLFAPRTGLSAQVTDPSAAIDAAWSRREQAFRSVNERRDVARASGDTQSFEAATSERDALIAELADEAGVTVVPKLLFQFSPDAAKEIGPSIYLVDLTDAS